jgi:integrase
LTAALLHFMPSLRGTLYQVSRVLSGARASFPAKHRPPLSKAMVGCIIVALLEQGHDFDAAAVWLQWELCGRISEVRKLRHEDITFSDQNTISFSLGPSARGESTKTSQDVGEVLHNSALSLLLLRLRAQQPKRKPRSFFFKGSQSKFDRHFSEIQQNLWTLRYTSHSIRHGRASYEDAQGTSALQIAKIGRWASARSAVRYRKPHLLVESEKGAFPGVLDKGVQFWNNPTDSLRAIFGARLSDLI